MLRENQNQKLILSWRRTKKMSLENVAVQTKNPASTKHKQKKHKNQILELRQKIYTNLKENKNVFSMMKHNFKSDNRIDHQNNFVCASGISALVLPFEGL